MERLLHEDPALRFQLREQIGKRVRSVERLEESLDAKRRWRRAGRAAVLAGTSSASHTPRAEEERGAEDDVETEAAAAEVVEAESAAAADVVEVEPVVVVV